VSFSDTVTGLRNERKACHFWVDNEVADCYQPIVGADAIWVYCRIARNAHGAWIVSPKRRGDTRVSLREMAEWCGKSVDTVWRCLQVLEHVGLLHAVHGAKSKGRYALADVKDLVTREGGFYDRELGSFQLPEKRIAELTQQVRELRLKLARKKAGVSSVAQSDSLEQPAIFAPGDECDRSVAPSDASVAHRATASITTRSNQAKQTTTPLPPQVGACGLEVSGGSDASKTKDLPASMAIGDVRREGEVLRMGTANAAVRDAAGDRADGHADPAGHGNERADGAAVEHDQEQREDDAGPDRAEGSGLRIVPAAGEVELPLDEEQLAHLAKHADDPAFVARWTGYYREQNLENAQAAAMAAETARLENERIERLRAELADVPAAKGWVMRQCGFIERNRRRGIGQVIEAVLQQEREEGRTLLDVAQEMVKAWKSYQTNGELLRIQYGPVKFFELGIWKNSRGWAWNEEKLEQMRGASVGSWR
jgi:hypothetical protein